MGFYDEMTKPCPCGFGCWEGKGCLAKDEPDDCAATGDGCQPETVHGLRQCRYCGKDMGPSPLGIFDVPASTVLFALVELAVEEARQTRPLTHHQHDCLDEWDASDESIVGSAFLRVCA